MLCEALAWWKMIQWFWFHHWLVLQNCFIPFNTNGVLILEGNGCNMSSTIEMCYHCFYTCFVNEHLLLYSFHVGTPNSWLLLTTISCPFGYLLHMVHLIIYIVQLAHMITSRFFYQVQILYLVCSSSAKFFFHFPNPLCVSHFLSM